MIPRSLYSITSIILMTDRIAVIMSIIFMVGRIIAVNYEARSFGITRHMRGKEAKEKCPDIVLVSVPCLRGKADTSR